MTPRPATDADRAWIRDLLTERWGESRIVVGGRARDAAGLPALVAIGDDGRPAGLLTYDTGPAGLEVVSLDAVERGGGVGTALLAAARAVAAGLGLRRVWLVTTNDNVDALRFYQRRGLRITAVHPGAVDRARLIKPGIAATGEHRIGLHDEIELAVPVSPARIRAGAMDDIPAVLGLLDAATEWLVARGRTGQWGTEPHSGDPRRRAQLAAWVPPGHLHIAELDGRPVGALVVGAAPAHVPAAGEPELYVELLVTSRGHAGHGLGGDLLDHARVLALGRGLRLLRVDCYAGGDRALVGWYERQGFRATDAFAVTRPDGTQWPGQVLAQELG
ncbi:GNAT family N-acetyltransferase [Dactylosporangium vinaceum]|uniref:GNAT family N-acetyltransferase n=1 Tax=Dactylosporangium vinaceum TaxID=53362 RepID=A0ABV5MFE7_9ACTN|nr:GNAT family N-acetyltransferase [Dactylosporangium vinaceum]